jgi:hypothetical protein
MQIFPIVAFTAFSVVRLVAEPGAPKVEACLSTHEMREAIEEHRAVEPLIALRAAGAGEKIRAQLCKTDTGLFYLITALGRDGRVSRIFVDALSGLRVGAR